MSSNDGIRKTLFVAFALCIVCSVVVSTAAVVLKPAQQANQLLDRKRNILSAAGMLDESRTVEEQFESISTRVVDLRNVAGVVRTHVFHPAQDDDALRIRDCGVDREGALERVHEEIANWEEA